MAAAAVTAKADLAVEEARLARAAAAGDGRAFAALYERYGRRAYNLALRISGSEEDAADAVQEAFLGVMRRLPSLGDRQLAFGSYLFTATRNATYDLMNAQRRAQPSDSIPESAVPVGAGAGGLGLDPGDPEEDPGRRVLLASQQEEIRAANGRLPERQREALALRELEDLSYDEIAELMEMNRNSVAQLISRARINLRDELRATALASVVADSPECERALPLIAMRDDGQLDEGGEDAAWLTHHLRACERCRIATEAMQEAGASYRAWVPVAIAPWLFKATMARAAELTGADWSEQIASGEAADSSTGSPAGMPAAYRAGDAAAARSSRDRRRAGIAAAVAALLLGGGAAAVFADGDDGSPPTPIPAQPAPDPAAAADTEPAGQSTESHQRHRRKPTAEKRRATNASGLAPGAEQSAGAPPQQATYPSVPKTGPRPHRGGGAALHQTKPTQAPPPASPGAEPPPQPKPKPAPVDPPAPLPAEQPPTTAPPAEEPSREPPPTTTEQPPREEPPPREPPEEETTPPREPPVGAAPGGRPGGHPGGSS